MYRYIASLLPQKLRENYYHLFVYNNLKAHPEKLLGFMLFVVTGFSVIVGVIFSFFFEYSMILIIVLTFITSQVLAYLLLSLKADSNAKAIETILPDALRIMASNLRAGLTVDKAFLSSSRPEFGILNVEINKVGKEVTTGKSLVESLQDMARRIRSDKVKKTIFVIISGLESGGELASLLEQTSKNLRNQTFIEEKVKGNIMMYFIFIFIAIGLGCPALFGLSNFLVQVLISIMNDPSLTTTSTLSASSPISFGGVGITAEFIKQFSIISLITSSIMGSLILGLINDGKEKKGLKYMPILIGLSLVLFFLTLTAMKTTLGSLFGF